MMSWGNGLIRLVDFLNFSFRIHISRPAGSQCGVHFFVPHPIFLALRARNIGCVSEKQRGPLFFILLRSRRIDSKLSSAALL